MSRKNPDLVPMQPALEGLVLSALAVGHSQAAVLREFGIGGFDKYCVENLAFVELVERAKRVGKVKTGRLPAVRGDEVGLLPAERRP